ncbi:isocitrate lyase/phosphoenolpyruvate mutase family protein [Parasphingopyxis algicola]|uniref:isocitrate lyase/PEP mutase family protein n=1 Tax=Parasphingopyxis algicola TaxID=2026624 RepID=UPI0015A1B0CC|nr:isocitrate lyase/phosphoenolpyruvate mutase family protein [Parasphingopyxis algicola]QLC26109.1 isocitrate lyase/phosphoenolpyruvate mutase family protein [Parasphingopyxis algicola]
MTDQQDRARAFHALHVPGDPVILFNIWDAGSALAVAKAGAKALATGSASVAGARGYSDAESLPMQQALTNAERIVEAVDLPLTVDFEGAYAAEPVLVGVHAHAMIETGAIGINFEDQVIGGESLHPVDFQVERITAVRTVAENAGVDFFINARTDMWLQAGRSTVAEAARFDEAVTRAKAYADAGANGFFAPGLTDESEIAALCEASPLPVNAMMFEAMPSHSRLAELGVARISHGPGPWRDAMTALTEAARPLYEG